MDEKPAGKVSVKTSKTGSKYFSGVFFLDEKCYYLNITKKKDSEDYTVWVKPAEKKDDIPF